MTQSEQPTSRPSRPIRILLFSTLFPNAEMPRHGIFVENRLNHLRASGEVEARVVAPVPWFPLKSARFGEYATFAKVPKKAERHGVEVTHPRYLVIPKIGMSLAPWLLYRAAKRHVQALMREGYDFDLIDAHYFFPDGVAATMLARDLGKPVVITARGTDLNLIPQYHWPRRMIEWTANHADHANGVCKALIDVLVDDIGMDKARTSVLRNGVDLALFTPHDRHEVRQGLAFDSGESRLLLSVGHLIERKGHHHIIEAMPKLTGYTLLIAGDGPMEAALREQAERLGVAERVRFLGAVPHAELSRIYAAADALILASSREGWANVLLEAMACGTPVVASNVWGTPELVSAPEAGVLMPSLDAHGVAQGVEALFANLPDRAATRRYAERFSWDETTAGQLAVFRKVLAARKSA